jgi:hypothetical protein
MTLRRSHEVDHSGLRKRPQMAEVVNHLDSGRSARGHERTIFPNREATPFMFQLGYFEMQEEQRTAWEEQMREHKM